MAQYNLTLQFYGPCGKESLSFKTKSAGVDEEDVKDILNSFVENPDVRTLLSRGLTFVVETVVKKHR